MPKCRIAERTLELNVCCSMIEDLRRRGLLAYIEGYTLRHEGNYGLDVSIKVPPSARLLSLQFKKPVKCLDYRKRYIFLFNNNKWRDQHLLLLLLSLALSVRGKKPSIYYALPLICDLAELEQRLPNILGETLFVEVLGIPFLGFHPCELYVNIDRTREVFFRCSGKRSVKFYSWETISREALDTAITAEDLEGIADVEFEELEEVLVSYLEKHDVPGGVVEEVIEYIKRRRMKQRVTAIAVRRSRFETSWRFLL